VTIAASVGIARAPALAFAVLVHVATLAITSVGGVVVLIFGGRRRRVTKRTLTESGAPDEAGE
jgi:hypothetical protein